MLVRMFSALIALVIVIACSGCGGGGGGRELGTSTGGSEVVSGAATAPNEAADETTNDAVDDPIPDDE